jgi:hypothetical protein
VRYFAEISVDWEAILIFWPEVDVELFSDSLESWNVRCQKGVGGAADFMINLNPVWRG